MLGSIFDFFLIFSYLFCFSLNGGYGIDSSILVGVYLVIYGFLHPRYTGLVFNFAFRRYAIDIFKYYLLINSWALCIIGLNGSLDFSFLLTFLHMCFLIVVGILLYLYFVFRGVESEIVMMMVLAFAIQSIIEWCAFLVPSFKELINLTKNEETILKGQGYAGVRANSLAGSDFFGLSAAFAIIYLIFLSKKNICFQNNRGLKFLLFLLILSGTFFAGRTGYVGLIPLFLYVFLNKRKVFSGKPYNIGEKLIFCMLAILSFGVMNGIVYLYNTDESISNLLNFTLQVFFSFKETGSAKISSMESLDNMYFAIDFFTFLFGDGQYTTKTGAYYMATDVGYMRVVLFFGIVGLLMMFSLQCKIMKLHLGEERKLKKYILFLLLILSLKGEVLVWNQIVLDVVVLYCLQDVFNNRHTFKSLTEV